ncbi:MAG: hypothetical protein IPJ00_21250 [Saprospirales bacterium]|nr:hypothetical protein [Saprospirales bacterium]
MRKNVAGQSISKSLISKTTGDAVTSGTTTVYVTGDNGTQTAGGGTVAHKGNGEWSYAPTQAETNYAHIAYTFVNSNAVTETVNVYTVGQDFTAAQLAANVTQISGDSAAADNLEAATDGTGFNLGGGEIVVQSITDPVSVSTLTTGALQTIRNEMLVNKTVITLSAPTTTPTSVSVPDSYENTGALVGMRVVHYTNAGSFIQARNIVGWDEPTQVLTVDEPWLVTPANTDLLFIWESSSSRIHEVVSKTDYELSAAYDLAKTAAQAGDAMSLANDAVNAASLAADALAEIKAEVEAVLATTARAELSAVPAANASLADKMTWIAMLLRNKRTQDDTTETVFADDGSTTVATSTKTVSAGTLTRSEYI